MTNDHVISFQRQACIKCGKTVEFIEDGPPQFTDCADDLDTAMSPSENRPSGGGIGVAGSPTSSARERLEPATPTTKDNP